VCARRLSLSIALLCYCPAADSYELKKRALHVYAEKQRVPDFRSAAACPLSKGTVILAVTPHSVAACHHDPAVQGQVHVFPFHPARCLPSLPSLAQRRSLARPPACRRAAGTCATAGRALRSSWLRWGG
jgi:hypothetical protein